MTEKVGDIMLYREAGCALIVRVIDCKETPRDTDKWEEFTLKVLAIIVPSPFAAVGEVFSVGHSSNGSYGCFSMWNVFGFYAQDFLRSFDFDLSAVLEAST